MKKKLLVLLAALAANTAFILIAVSPEFVTFAQVSPVGLAIGDLTSAAEAGREQVLGVIRSQHPELFILAAANIAIVLWGLRRDQH